MNLIFISILCLFGGVDGLLSQFFYCARCTNYTDAFVPADVNPPTIHIVFNHFIADNGCKMANFKCVLLQNGCNTTAYIRSQATEERLATFETSQTESIGGNFTCVATSTFIGWRFNGQKASSRCYSLCKSEYKYGPGDTVTNLEPTTPTTTSTTVGPTTTTAKPITTTVPPTTTSVKPTTTAVASTTVHPTVADDCDCEDSDCEGSSYDEGNYHRGYY
ncbi:hypothetical protein B9Z55_021723 [Caenorhabditis nigoni]|uniref:DUF281 domain-containing protein n=1 Tax=Caenorhabditis nigoni TaxID=1611254 RepID=A0A2G5TTD5_9PELO|nr:hypothetical protein B9Z55_021723 [Caenorhabditis nigoni]